MSHHLGAKKRVQSALDTLSGEYAGKLELGEHSKLTGIGIGTPAGCYPLIVTLDAPYGDSKYDAERDHAASMMRHVGWHEVGSPDPQPGNPQNIIFNVRPEVVQSIIDAGIELRGQEHFTPPQQAPVRA